MIETISLKNILLPMHEIVAPVNGVGGLYLGNLKAAQDTINLLNK
jgi:hypothetical protein